MYILIYIYIYKYGIYNGIGSYIRTMSVFENSDPPEGNRTSHTGLVFRKISFGTNRVHMRAPDATIPAFCMEFRSGSNGTSPGVKNPKILENIIYIYGIVVMHVMV